MLEMRVAKVVLRFFGVEQPNKFDKIRFVSRFKLNEMKTSRKIILGMLLPVMINLLEFKLFGNYEEIEDNG